MAELLAAALEREPDLFVDLDELPGWIADIEYHWEHDYLSILRIYAHLGTKTDWKLVRMLWKLKYITIKKGEDIKTHEIAHMESLIGADTIISTYNFT